MQENNGKTGNIMEKELIIRAIDARRVETTAVTAKTMGLETTTKKTIEERAILNLEYEQDFCGCALSENMVRRAYVKGWEDAMKALSGENKE